MAEKKTTKAAAEKKPAAEKKACATKRTCASKKAALVIDSISAGFKAGDVYEALAAAGQPLSVKEISASAKTTDEETYVGIGWLFKEGKIVEAEGKYTLA